VLGRGGGFQEAGVRTVLLLEAVRHNRVSLDVWPRR
jgi:hypothetical protein